MAWNRNPPPGEELQLKLAESPLETGRLFPEEDDRAIRRL
jgi:hypothetical protein